MPLADELKAEVAKILATHWKTRDGTTIPAPDDLGLGNDAVKFDAATVLYADLADSTGMVSSQPDHFAAEVYKSFLYSAARVIRAEGGEITAYDGDRVMAVFLGDSKNTSAARTALKINYAVTHIINPAISTQYPQRTFRLRHVVGIDTSAQFVARTGVRGDNDLVWVGRAANYAAKLTTLPADYPTWITGTVYDALAPDLKTGGNPPRAMWEERTWTPMNGLRIYRSNWWWSIN
jgi:class 3 adenylate cyclase